MNKHYSTKEINSAWLVELNPDSTIGGIKNIIGIIIEYNNEKLFYSILDDCFFRILPSREKQIDNLNKYYNRIFAEVYTDDNSYMIPIGIGLYKSLKKDSLTKEEIIANKKLITGHYSDFDYELSVDTNVDYENVLTIDENIINSISEYKEKLGRPITYDEGHIYGPTVVKTLTH